MGILWTKTDIFWQAQIVSLCLYKRSVQHFMHLTKFSQPFHHCPPPPQKKTQKNKKANTEKKTKTTHLFHSLEKVIPLTFYYT